jgi:transglutaminase-like putative cysteine protease
MRLDIRYRCRFEYEEPVRESQNELRAVPITDQRQQLISARVSTSPGARVFSFTDYWGTRVDTFGVREPHGSLEVVAEASVETRRTPVITAAPQFETVRSSGFRNDYLEYLEPTEHTAWSDAIVSEARRQAELAGPNLIDVLLAIYTRVGKALRYAPGTTYVGVEVEEVLARGSGVCQDYAHLAVAMCRSLGIPARYVSGYLFTTNDATGVEGEGDVVKVQTHAWFEAALPDLGWLALDPTNAKEVGVRHVKIGHGRDYGDVPPLRGVFSGQAGTALDVAVEMRRVGPQPVIDIAAARSRAAAEAQARMHAARERRARLAQQQQQQQ